MTTLEFTAKVIDSVAWPASVVALVLILKNPIQSLIPLLSKLKYKDVELEFGKDVNTLSAKVKKELSGVQNNPETEDLRKRVMSIMPVSPKAAVVEVWRALETEIIDLCTKSKMELDHELLKKPLKMAELLVKAKLIDETQFGMIEDMRLLRNRVVHYEKEQITPENALEFLESGVKLISSLSGK